MVIKGISSIPAPAGELDQDFIEVNTIIKLHSGLTGEDFYLCSTPKLLDECRVNDPDTVAYLPHEIRYLSGLKTDEAKKMHCARKIFGGEIIQRNRLDDSLFAGTQKEIKKYAGIYNPRLGLKNKISTERDSSGRG